MSCGEGCRCRDAYRPAGDDELGRKLQTFDEHADQAVDYLISWLTYHRDYIIAIARGRHCWGHYRFGDKLMYEYGPEELEANAVEELADGVVYITRRISLRAE